MFLRVDGFSMGPRVLEHHNLVSETRYAITLGLLGVGLGHAVTL